MKIPSMRCDGCGQVATPEHIAARLRRLEWTTRYRPVHISTLLLSGVSPSSDSEFLYTPGGKFTGEASLVLKATTILAEGKTAEDIQTEFQRAGLFLTHVLECPLNENPDKTASELMEERLPVVIARIRRSLKPKRVIILSDSMADAAKRISKMELDCQILLDNGRPFSSERNHSETMAQRLGEAFSMG